MQSFKTNDGVTLKYIDSAVTDPEAAKKDTLILVRFAFLFAFASKCTAD